MEIASWLVHGDGPASLSGWRGTWRRWIWGLPSCGQIYIWYSWNAVCHFQSLKLARSHSNKTHLETVFLNGKHHVQLEKHILPRGKKHAAVQSIPCLETMEENREPPRWQTGRHAVHTKHHNNLCRAALSNHTCTTQNAWDFWLVSPCSLKNHVVDVFILSFYWGAD